MSRESQELLGLETCRLLGDKSYDKRKQGADEITPRIREAASLSDRGESVRKILDCLRRDFLESGQINNRKGGLLGFACAALGLDEVIGDFLKELVMPVLNLFEDKDDAKVRYYAVESLFNIAKVADKAIFTLFNDIFEGMAKLHADADMDVKNGVRQLDTLLADMVKHGSAPLATANFVPKLAGLLHLKNPFLREMLLGWVRLLLKDPAQDMVSYLPLYLEGLFNMLADQSRTVWSHAGACLKDALRNVKELDSTEKALHIAAQATGIVVKCCTAADPYLRLSALCWLHEFVSMQAQALHLMIRPQGDQWEERLPEMLRGTLHCIDDQEDEIARMAVEMNSSLLEIAKILPKEMPVNALVDQLLQAMQSRDSMVVRTACLQWVCLLLEQCPERMLHRPTLDRLFDPIFETLKHTEDEVVAAALNVLAQIMEGRKAEQDELANDMGHDLFTFLANRLLQLFKRERKMLEAKGRLMIRHLCGHLDERRLYVTVAKAIQEEASDEGSLEFVQQLVQTFSWILFTATETRRLREELVETKPIVDKEKDGVKKLFEPPGRKTSSFDEVEDKKKEVVDDQRSLFLQLLEPWFHNPVSALTLCLWSQQYDLAVDLTARLTAIEPGLELLKQLDQLVYLLESPVFSRLRLRLLEPHKHPALLKSLLALAMLLPQAGAFGILRERLHVIQSGLLLQTMCLEDAAAEAEGSSPPTSNGVVANGHGASQIDAVSLLEKFDEVIERAQRGGNSL